MLRYNIYMDKHYTDLSIIKCVFGVHTDCESYGLAQFFASGWTSRDGFFAEDRHPPATYQQIFVSASECEESGIAYRHRNVSKSSCLRSCRAGRRSCCNHSRLDCGTRGVYRYGLAGSVCRTAKKMLTDEHGFILLRNVDLNAFPVRTIRVAGRMFLT